MERGGGLEDDPLQRSKEGELRAESSDAPSEVSEIAFTLLSDLKLPSWASGNDIADPFEALGEFYGKARKAECVRPFCSVLAPLPPTECQILNNRYAIPLYLQALSFILAPASASSAPLSIEDRCRVLHFLFSPPSLLFFSNKSQPHGSCQTSHPPSSSRRTRTQLLKAEKNYPRRTS